MTWTGDELLNRGVGSQEGWGGGLEGSVSDSEAEARDVASVIKHRMRMLAHQHEIYQYQEITPSMAVTTVSMHYSNVNLTSIEYYKASNNFLSEKNVT